jgi:hypothetical protein
MRQLSCCDAINRHHLHANPKVGWTLQDTSFVDQFTASDLWTECMGSDHCPVWADLDVPILPLPQGFLPPALSTSHTFAGLLPVTHA